MKRIILYIILLTSLLMASCAVTGVCTDKEHILPKSKTGYRHYGHTALPEIEMTSEKWMISIRSKDRIKDLKVSKEQYNAVEIGDSIIYLDGMLRIVKERNIQPKN